MNPRPSFLSYKLLLLFISSAITVSLAIWQFGRAEQKQQLLTNLAKDHVMALLTEADISYASTVDINANAYRGIRLRGQWLSDATIYLENRQYQGRPGFWVLTPLVAKNVDVLVIRGWVPRDGQSRQRIPSYATAVGEVCVQGRLLPKIPEVFQLGKNPDIRAGGIRLNVSVAEYSAWLGQNLKQSVKHNLHPMVIQQTQAICEGEPALSTVDGLSREVTLDRTDINPSKHTGYAWQWLLLTLLQWVYFFWPKLKSINKQYNSKRNLDKKDESAN